MIAYWFNSPQQSNPKPDNVDTLRKLTRTQENAITQALEVLRNRIDSLGVSEPTLQRQGDNSIIIQLPGLKDRAQAIELIGPQAVLEFVLSTTMRPQLPIIATLKLFATRKSATPLHKKFSPAILTY